MKLREFMMLQLFADDPTPADPVPQDPKPGDPANSKPADPKPDDLSHQPKYTDDDVDKILSQKFSTILDSSDADSDSNSTAFSDKHSGSVTSWSRY